LRRDRETAETLKNILENSDTPYLKDYDFLGESLGVIDECVKTYDASAERWLTEYNF
jgi:hypothetical protein